jgi:hypothetical protein
MPGAAVPAHLHRHGVPNVLAPLLTTTGRPFAQLGRSPSSTASPSRSTRCWRPAPGLGERTRRAAVDGFRSLFAAGNIVDLALLPPQ